MGNVLTWQHFFHDELRNIVKRRYTSSYILLNSFDLFLPILYFIRSTLVLLSTNYNFQIFSINFRHDIIFVFIEKHIPEMMNLFLTYLIIITIFLMGGIIKIYFCNPNTLAFQVPYELAVLNNKCIWSSLKSKQLRDELLMKNFENNLRHLQENGNFCDKILPKPLFIWYCWLKSKLYFLFDVQQIKPGKLNRFKLNYIPFISPKCRMLIFGAFVIIDLSIHIFFIGICKNIHLNNCSNS